MRKTQLKNKHLSKENPKKVLIVGIESQIGSALKELLINNSFDVKGTTRKKETNKNTYFLDLEEPDYEVINKKFNSIIICAAVTNIAKCEENPNECGKINVTNTIKLIDTAVANNSFVVFLSSNAVFDGSKSFYKYTDTTNPKTRYGKFKNAVEKYIKNRKSDKVCVLRITKVITKNTPFIKRWENESASGLSIRATNRLLSPVPIDRVVDTIKLLIDRKQSGIYQLGGSEEVSYFEYAHSYFKNSSKNLKLITAGNEGATPLSIEYNSLTTYLPIDNDLT